nr:EamA family transporter [Candidatus Njordarchaeum guaymaensis]
MARVLKSVKQSHGYVLLALVSILWGTIGILARLSYAYGILPVTLIALRLLISSATLLFALMLFSRGSLRVRKSDLLTLLLFGVLAVAFQRLAFAYAVYFITPTMTAVLFYTYPVFVTLSAWLFLKERITWREVSAIILTFLGVALVVRAYDPSSLSDNLLGIVFGLASSLSFVLYFLMTKRFRSRYAGWTVTLYGDGIGALVLSPAILASVTGIMGFPLELWLLILTIAWVLSLLGYLMFSHALKYVKASKGSILSAIEPLSAALFSTLLLGESLETLQVVGIALALIGVIILFEIKGETM